MILITEKINFITESYRSVINPIYKSHVDEVIARLLVALLFALLPYETPLEPLFDLLRILGWVVVIAAAYGILNDLIACRVCIEYFTIGHVFDEQHNDKRLVYSLNPNLNAFFWGVAATNTASCIAGVLIAWIAGFPIDGRFYEITAIQLLPYFFAMALSTLIIADLSSRIVCAIISDRNITITAYKDVPAEYKLRWLACDIRNSIGYLALCVWTIVLMLLIIQARRGDLVL